MQSMDQRAQITGLVAYLMRCPNNPTLRQAKTFLRAELPGKAFDNALTAALEEGSVLHLDGEVFAASLEARLRYPDAMPPNVRYAPADAQAGLHYNDIKPRPISGSLGDRCVLCGKSAGTHNANTRACSIGKSGRAGHASFSRYHAFTPKEGRWEHIVLAGTDILAAVLNGSLKRTLNRMCSSGHIQRCVRSVARRICYNNGNVEVVRA